MQNHIFEILFQEDTYIIMHDSNTNGLGYHNFFYDFLK